MLGTAASYESQSLSGHSSIHSFSDVSRAMMQSFLERRGLSFRDLDYLLHPQASHQHDPFLLTGVTAFIHKLHHLKGQTFAIVPDYDADGILSGTLARTGLYLLGFGDVMVYPPKTREGYGLTKQSVDQVLAAQPDTQVILTTDNGSNAHRGVRYAQSKGLRVLVTDHHIADHTDVTADAEVNPNRRQIEGSYPYPDISGTAVIYKVLLAYARTYIPEDSDDTWSHFGTLTLLVGASAVCDMMPLLDENRFYVTHAAQMLDYLAETYSDRRVQAYQDSPLDQYYRGLDLLVGTLRANGKLKYGVSGDTFGFTVGPILNSPRRMTGDSALGFDLFHTDRSVTQESTPADALFDLNEERKRYVRTLKKALFDTVDAAADSSESSLRPLDFMVFNARMGAGIAGLLSGGFTNTYDLPSVAFAAPDASSDDVINAAMPHDDERLISGSARSPEWFNLHDFLAWLDAAHPDLIHTWGGHAQAAGVTLRVCDFDRFRHLFVSGLEQELQAIVQGDDDDGAAPDALRESVSDRLFGSEFVLQTSSFDFICRMHDMPSRPFIVPMLEGTPATEQAPLMEAVRAFEAMAPYGQGFHKPLFDVAFRMSDVSVFHMGAEKQHIKLTLPNGLAMIHWNGAEVFEDASFYDLFIASGSLGINCFKGRETLQLIMDHVALVGQAS